MARSLVVVGGAFHGGSAGGHELVYGNLRLQFGGVPRFVSYHYIEVCEGIACTIFRSYCRVIRRAGWGVVLTFGVAMWDQFKWAGVNDRDFSNRILGAMDVCPDHYDFRCFCLSIYRLFRVVC